MDPRDGSIARSPQLSTQIGNRQLRATVDEAIGAVAEQHGGHISREQLIALGLARHEIDYRVRVGRLIAVYPGIYAVGRPATTPHDHAAGALLAAGPGAALSHWTAAYFWRMWEQWCMPIELTSSLNRRRTGLRIHRLVKLDARDKRWLGDLLVTSPARTALDIAPRLGDRLTRVINNARIDKGIRLTQSELRDVLDRFPRHPGAKYLRPFVDVTRGPTRSDLEDTLQRFIDHFTLPQPLISHEVAGYEVDAYFSDERLILEVDGWDVHKTKEAFEADRLRDADILARTGIPTVRATYDRLTRLAEDEAARLRTILDARR